MPRPLETLESKVDEILALLGTGISPIKRIQTGYVTGVGSTSSGEDTRYIDTTITAVDTAKSIVLVQSAGNSTAGNPYGYTGRLTSSTNVRVSTSTTSAFNARWTVVEFN